jgi:hypothetical protein
MQFGKFHGIALLALGSLLVLMQVFMAFQGLDRSASRPQPTDQSLQAESRHNYRALGAFEYVPAAAGTVLIGLGLWVIVRRQKEILDHFPPQNSAKFRGVASSRR